MIQKISDIEFKLFLQALLERYHYDFHGYSKASLKRRLALAKEKFGLETFSQLQEKVLYDPSFFSTLISYLTVQVSEMFRDPPFFKVIREKIIPHLKTYPSLKVWVAGCSAGEELYSLAIIFREEGLEERTIFYGTDINREALRKAESGVYGLDKVPAFTKNYQLSGGKNSFSTYYTAGYDSIVLDKSLRKRAVFSDHSLVSDSVFAEMHLICCRNVLIYFDRELQDRAVGLFRDSLVRRGFLGLGAKETLRFSKYSSDFSDFSHEERIYQKKAGFL